MVIADRGVLAIADQMATAHEAVNQEVVKEMADGGYGDARIATAVDKMAEMEGLVGAKGGGGASVYVGDSITDVLAMLKADYGVVGPFCPLRLF
eukprot:890826-Rhodomonas_salina.1